MSTAITATQLQGEPEPPITTSDEHLHYIQSLNESPECYTRFFDALLIKKSSHTDFFCDLKAFREQPDIIRLLELDTREVLRECTVVYLGSRFAHPWCRTSSAHASGWSKASWVGKTKKLTDKARKEEDQLHRLLVPIWIAFRRRMYPGPEVVQDWIDREPERLAGNKAEADAKKQAAASVKQDSSSSNSFAATDYPELGFATPKDSSSTLRPTTSDHESSAAAGQMFLGVAVTGFIMSDKRVRKYVEKKLKKNK